MRNFSKIVRDKEKYMKKEIGKEVRWKKLQESLDYKNN